MDSHEHIIEQVKKYIYKKEDCLVWYCKDCRKYYVTDNIYSNGLKYRVTCCKCGYYFCNECILDDDNILSYCSGCKGDKKTIVYT